MLTVSMFVPEGIASVCSNSNINMHRQLEQKQLNSATLLPYHMFQHANSHFNFIARG